MTSSNNNHGLSFWHPAHLMATWFGAGLLPKAPGTWGSLAALPFAYGMLMLFPSPYVLFLAAGILFFPGCWASAAYASSTGNPDPGAVVVDEVVGQWMVLAVAPFSPIGWLLAFVLFRLFDVVKPWPISLADRHIKGGFGIMFDDVIAAAFGMVIMVTLVAFTPQIFTLI
ncbi:MAG: phosphatidylglycerophosphatase A [Parvibaculaceae bacterium]|nr:phosphatidylglycerophosphatase A [Parvibaculaceae bacterium]